MRQTHLWREASVEVDGETTVCVTIEAPNQERSQLWYRLPTQYSSLITPSCDPFVVATILLFMRWSAPVVVHGQVSPSLLQNLEEFQAAWVCWHPSWYQKIEITAEVEREIAEVALSDEAITTFSGGVDSCFTAWRHRTAHCGRQQRNLQAAVMVHGFDIPLEQQQAFDSAVAKSREMLSSLGVALIPVATNFRELAQDWEDAHGAGIASCLMLLQRGYKTGLIASGPSYKSLVLPQGSNPITDSFLSSNAFQIIHDGAGFSRLEKIKEIAQWPEALQNLRVCWEGSQLDRNCGQCEKCIRTILSFRAWGMSLPPCFEQDVTDRQIRDIRVKKAQLEVDFVPILKLAKAMTLSDSWVSNLEKCIADNQRWYVREERKASLREALEKREAWLKKHLPPRVRSQLGKLRSRLSPK